jgi:predicted nuclease with TOPRIM domain
MPTDAIECPLCLGEGELKRTEVLDRLGVKDLARVAQLSAEEAFRLLLGKHKDDQQSVWLRFETELAKRMAEIRDRHKDELHATQSERDNLTRRVEDCLREVGQLRERNQELEAEMSKVSRIGKREEMDFADEARTWAGVSVSEKLPRNGDFIVAYRDPSGASVEPRMLIDNKDKAAVTEGDIAKLVRDAKERSLSVAVLVARTEEQLRQIDRECRWGEKDGVWILRTTRQCLPRDLEVLKPLLERMRTEGPDFLQRNAALAEEIRRTFADIDAIEKELGKASKAIQSVSGLVAKYKGRLERLCESPVQNKPSRSATVSSNDLQSAGA